MNDNIFEGIENNEADRRKNAAQRPAGSIFDGIEDNEPVRVAAPVAPPAAENKLASALGYVGMIAMLVGIIAFMSTPFISAAAGERTFVQHGFALWGVPFGGRNELGLFGVYTSTLNYAALSYMWVLINAVSCAVCFALMHGYGAKNRSIMAFVYSSVVMFAGVYALIISVYTSRAVSMGGGDVSYMGGIGVFCSAAVGFLCSLSAFLLTRRAQSARPPQKRRTGCNIVSVTAGALTLLALFLTVYLVPRGRSFEVEVNAAGRATVSPDYDLTVDKETYKIGTAVFYIDGLTAGETYVFEVALDMNVEAEVMKSSVLLFFADDIESGSSEDICNAYLDGACLLENQTYRDSFARLAIECDETIAGKKLAVAFMLGFAYNGSVSYDYFFRSPLVATSGA